MKATAPTRPHGQPSRAVGALHVADLARRAGVTPATVRYYARIGLLNPGREADNGYRRFSSDDLRRVLFVRKAQALGLTIADIRLVLEEVAHETPPCHLVVDLVETRLAEVRRRQCELAAAERRMASALREWSSTGASDAGEICPLIEGIELAESVLEGPSGNGRGLHAVGAHASNQPSSTGTDA